MEEIAHGLILDRPGVVVEEKVVRTESLIADKLDTTDGAKAHAAARFIRNTSVRISYRSNSAVREGGGPPGISLSAGGVGSGSALPCTQSTLTGCALPSGKTPSRDGGIPGLRKFAEQPLVAARGRGV